MKRLITRCLLLALLLVVANGSVHAAFSANIFGDYYFILKQHLTALEKLNGFIIRRVYFTYESDLSDKLKARARLELNADGKYQTSQQSITPVLKDAYVAYQFASLHKLTLGIQDSLTWANIEKFYGYRHLEKTAFDLYKVRSSRDTALTLSGSFDKAKKLNYALQFGNYSGNKTENDKYKQVAAAFIFNPSPKLSFEVNGDLATISAVKTSYLWQAFAGYQGDWGRVGLDYGQEIVKETGKDDVDFGIFQIFGVAKLGKAIEAFARYDMTADPQRYGQDQYLIIEKNFKTNLFILGLGWNISPKFQIMPNLKMVSYKDNGALKAPESDTQFNVTFNVSL